METPSIFDPSIRADPFPVFNKLREDSPVFFEERIPGGAWLISRHADVARGLRDPRLSGDRMPLFRMVLRDTDEARAFDDSISRWLLNLEGPRHARLRALVSKAFAPRIITELRPRIRAITDRLLDEVAPTGKMDVMRDLALPLPVTIIAELLGLPLADVPLLRTWSTDIAYFFGSMRGIKKAQASDAEMRAYLRKTVEERRKSLGSDLLSAMLVAEDKGQTLSEADIISTSILLFIAGHETTTNLIGNGLLALLQHPAELALLREDPKRIPNAIEEMLRHCGVVPYLGRAIVEDFELDGKKLAKGQYAILVLAAANRDPAAFSDPDTFDVLREASTKHVGFGLGAHFCIGAALARVEATIAFETLLRRFPKLSLANDVPVWQESVGIRGLAELPITFSA